MECASSRSPSPLEPFQEGTKTSILLPPLRTAHTQSTQNAPPLAMPLAHADGFHGSDAHQKSFLEPKPLRRLVGPTPAK